MSNSNEKGIKFWKLAKLGNILEEFVGKFFCIEIIGAVDTSVMFDKLGYISYNTYFYLMETNDSVDDNEKSFEIHKDNITDIEFYADIIIIKMAKDDFSCELKIVLED